MEQNWKVSLTNSRKFGRTGWNSVAVETRSQRERERRGGGGGGGGGEREEPCGERKSKPRSEAIGRFRTQMRHAGENAWKRKCCWWKSGKCRHTQTESIFMASISMGSSSDGRPGAKFCVKKSRFSDAGLILISLSATCTYTQEQSVFGLQTSCCPEEGENNNSSFSKSA